MKFFIALILGLAATQVESTERNLGVVTNFRDQYDDDSRGRLTNYSGRGPNRPGLRRNAGPQRAWKANMLRFTRPWRGSRGAQIVAQGQSSSVVNYSATVTNSIVTDNSNVYNSELTVDNPIEITSTSPVNVQVRAANQGSGISGSANGRGTGRGRRFNLFMTPRNSRWSFIPERVRSNPKCRFNTDSLVSYFNTQAKSPSFPDLTVNNKLFPRSRFSSILQNSDVYIDNEDTNPQNFFDALNGDDGSSDGVNFDSDGYGDLLSGFEDIATGDSQ